MIGVASGLSRLDDGDEEYLFLTHPEHEDWLLPVPRRSVPDAPPAPSVHAPPRPAVRQGAARAASRRSAPGYSVRRSDGTIEEAGVDVIHFPFQDAFTTEVPSLYQPHDLQHLHLPELFSPLEPRAPRERSTARTANGPMPVVAMTSWGRRDFIESYGLPEEKVWVVPGRLGPAGVPGAEPRRTSSRLARAALAARPLPLLPGAALAPQEPRAAARGTRVGPRADGQRRSRWSAPGPRRRGTSTGSAIAPRARPRGDDRSSPGSSARRSSVASTSWPPPSSSRAASRAGGCRYARRSPPGCRSPRRRRPACPTWSATPG